MKLNFSLAAACCGGGVGLPQFITGDFKGQLSLSSRSSLRMGEVSTSGESIYWLPKNQLSFHLFQMDASFLTNDFWQFGISLPFITEKNNSGLNIGDIHFSGAYEFLPERYYSLWVPRSFIFSQIKIPSSNTLLSQTNTHSISLGVFFIKTIGDWDHQELLQLIYNFPHKIYDQKIFPGISFSGMLSGGYNFFNSQWRIGLGLAPLYEDKSNNETGGFASPKLVWNSSLSMSYLPAPEWLWSLTFQDQTLMGPTFNVVLHKSLIFTLQKRWGI